ncbi:MAG TPA: hypothetical protein VJU87_06295 [Gemmatimonadaceae bacterium]|nr:hypothetical protein [Gemmatimonadaceae bacterium]
MRPSPVAVIAAFGLAVATRVSAQAATAALPFHAGQWGGQFAVGSDVQSIGLLRFHSPSAAFVFDLSAAVNQFSTDAGFGSDQKSTSENVSLRVGPRRYAPVASQVAHYLGAGLLANLAHAKSNIGGTSTSARSLTAGAYAELGGDYLVTPHLAIGVQGTAQATYGRTSNSSQAHLSSWSVGLGATRLVATIFF